MATFNWPALSLTTTPSPVQFLKNATPTSVSQDTTTPSNSTPLPVLNLNGTGVEAGTASAPFRVDVTGTTTQPISAASLPLPTGAATSAKQPALGVAGTPSADVLTVQGAVSMTALKVDGSGVTQPVSGTVTANQGSANATPWNNNIAQIAGAVPSATNGLSVRINNGVSYVDPTQIRNLTSTDVVTVSQATASNLKASVNLNDGAGVSVTVGQKVMASSLPVTLASDQGVLSTKVAGKTQANAPVRNDYTVTSVTTSAYVQLVASLTTTTTEIEIFDSSGQTLALATGGAGSEVNQIYIFPGGNGRVPLAIAAGTRVSIKAVSATASTGEIDINFYS